jgi:asparagine synthase (glutamine-hydrolysing)
VSTVFVFSLAAGFATGTPNAERVRLSMAGLPVAPADGVRTAHGPRGSASLGRWIVVKRDDAAAPLWDPVRGLLFAGDVRLYNRPELIRELGESAALDGEQSDLELARLAYLKWGQDAPLHLVGDFAFVAWDESNSRLFAARDHFGVRPLHYRRLPDGMVVASDVRQLLALLPSPAEELSSEQILEGLVRRPTDPTRTYFRGISRVAPGHVLLADVGDVHQARYWTPPSGSDGIRSYPENCERLRAVFERAVRDRLESDHPIVAHSSGGFDSSTIVMATDGIYRREPGRAPLTTVSAIAPGFPSDESRYIDAVAAAVTFPTVRWNVVAGDRPDFWGVSGGAPVLRQGLAGGPRRDLEVAREQGARVLLSGVLGDTLWHATGVRRDMVRHGRWVQAGFDILRPGLGGLTFQRFVDAALGLLPPRIAHRIGLRLFRAPPPPPEWLGPALRAIYSTVVAAPARANPGITDPSSHLRGELWAQLTSPGATRIVESFVDYAMDDGIELRAPYADVRLVEAVLSIPWRQREPRGHHRRTGRDALGALLPREFLARIGQPPWTEVWAANARRTASMVAPIINQGPWLSGPFVDRGIARAMLRDVLDGAGMERPWAAISVADFGALEAWIRQLFG